MRRIISVTLVQALLLVASIPIASASLIGVGTPIPDSEVLINFNNTGLDWVYAGPIAPNEFGPGQIQNASYRAAEGWRNATAAEWALKPAWQDFTKPGQVVPVGGTSDHSVYRFTSEYWSTFSHVDLSDAASGRITNGTDIGSLNGVYETWYVRTSAAGGVVPEPTTVIVWSGLGLIAGCLGYRRLNAT